MSQIIPYGDPALEMLYSFGRFLLPHLPLDRDTERVKLGDEVGAAILSSAADLLRGRSTSREGDPEGVKSPTDVGTGKAKEEKAPLSEIIKVLNERFGTNFTDEDRLLLRANPGEGRQATSRSSKLRARIHSTNSNSACASSSKT